MGRECLTKETHRGKRNLEGGNEAAATLLLRLPQRGKLFWGRNFQGVVTSVAFLREVKARPERVEQRRSYPVRSLLA